MKYAVILIAAISAGCSSTPPANVVEINRPSLRLDVNSAVPVIPKIDPLCGAFGKQVARIAELRDARVAIADVPLLLTPIADFPAGPMIREVYARTDITPPQGARNSYEACVARGYEGMVAALRQAEGQHIADEQKRIMQGLAAAKKTRTIKPTSK